MYRFPKFEEAVTELSSSELEGLIQQWEHAITQHKADSQTYEHYVHAIGERARRKQAAMVSGGIPRSLPAHAVFETGDTSIAAGVRKPRGR